MIQILPYTEQHTGAVRAFNERMRTGKAPTDFLLPESVGPEGSGPVRATQFVVVEQEDVRGGFIEFIYPGWVNGSEQTVANYQSPLSEGIHDRRYTLISLQMIQHIQQRQPYVFMVGMGDPGRPLPRLLQAFGWEVFPVPFLFRVENAARFLREIAPLRTGGVKRSLARAAALTGAGSVASRAWRALSVPAWTASRRYTIEPIDNWGPWADSIWEQFRSHCSLAVVRNSATLPALYPLGSGRVLGWMVKSGAEPVGWVTGLSTQMENNHYFGNLRVGTVLDCIAPPHALAATAWLATRSLARTGADIVLTNQQHLMWRTAFKQAGFIQASSNYLLGISKRLTEASRHSGGHDAIHITRGDGDGSVHL
ncbi:MAG: hypothetical protein JO182_26770 [Acidobacteriaceae bacterium]|nr:hypothetical protein [Acidobacteriaceae bacterium]